MAMINGAARRIYLEHMEMKEKKKVLFLDLPIRKGIISPIIIKLTILKIVPRIRPLPTGFWPAIIKKRLTKMDPIMALEQYFFCVSLRESIVGIVILFFFFSNFEDLAINDDASADNSQNRKNGDEYSFGS
jgi:hypothetical protein